MLNLIWGPPTDIWSLGATASIPRSRFQHVFSRLLTATKLISLIWGENWHIFKPPKIDPQDSSYPIEVLRRHDQYFGPFPLSYMSLADDDRLGRLTIIMNSIEHPKPFSMASSKEISKEDREFVCKLMRLDPRDRPSAEELLWDEWFG